MLLTWSNNPNSLCDMEMHAEARTPSPPRRRFHDPVEELKK